MALAILRISNQVNLGPQLQFPLLDCSNLVRPIAYNGPSTDERPKGFAEGVCAVLCVVVIKDVPISSYWPLIA